jgi:hypothetical protein
MREAFGRSEHQTIRKPYGELSRAEKALSARTHLMALVCGEVPTRTVSGKIPADQMVEISTWERIPGVCVELPSFHFAWESYHSEENAGGNPNYPAPALVDLLGLRKKGGAVDLVDAAGRSAMLYREFGNLSDRIRVRVLFLRADFVKKYLARVKRRLVWINWGERGIHYSAAQNLREDPSVQAVWSAHTHIHKDFVIYPMERLP